MTDLMQQRMSDLAIRHPHLLDSGRLDERLIERFDTLTSIAERVSSGLHKQIMHGLFDEADVDSIKVRLCQIVFDKLDIDSDEETLTILRSIVMT